MIQKKWEMFSNTVFMVQYLFGLNKKLFFIRIPLALLQTAFAFTSSFAFSRLIDELTARREEKTVIIYILFITFFNFCFALLNGYISKADKRQQEKTMLLIKHNLGAAVAGLPVCEIEKPGTRDFISLASETDSFSTIIKSLSGFLSSVINIITYSTVIVCIQPIIVGLIIINLIVQLILNKLKLKYNDKWRETQAPTLRKLWYLEGLLCDPRCGKELRVNRLRDWLLKKTDEVYEGRCVPIIKANARDANRIDFFGQMLGIFKTVVIYLLLTYEVLFCGMSVGDYSFNFTSATNLMNAFNVFTNSIFSLGECALFVREFRYFIECSRNLRKYYGDKKHLGSDFSIEFKNVSFKYPKTDNYVLKNVSMIINSGERLSLVGVNGSGKSTLVKLICRFYEPTEGEIYVGGINIKEYDAEEYARLLSVVFQDYKLFSFSVYDNITMGDEENPNRLESSVEYSGLFEKINGLIYKENTFVYKDFDENGVEFSGGEGQKLSLARAIYKNSPIIILDEPTAALDPMAEYEMYESFNSITENKTSIFISHRMAQTQFTDKIAVLQDGVLCEFGTHKELMGLADGIYRNMFDIQRRQYS